MNNELIERFEDGLEDLELYSLHDNPGYKKLKALFPVIKAALSTPPASEHQQTIQQPHTVEFVGKTCQRVLMAEGKPYPRTCAVCGLSGPCKSFPRENTPDER